MKETDIFEELYGVVEDRREQLPRESYTTSLFTHERGQNGVLEKIGEESTEVVLAAKDESEEQLVAESADLIYHVFVLLAMHDIELASLCGELADRRGKTDDE